MSTTFGPGGVSRSLSDPLSGSLQGIYGGFGNALQGYGQLAGTQFQPGQYSRDVEQSILADMMRGQDVDDQRLRQSQDARLAAMGIALDPRSAAYSRQSQALEDQIARNRANMRLGARGQAVQEYQTGLQNARQAQLAGLAGLGGMTGGTIQGALGQAMSPVSYATSQYTPTNISGITQNYDQLQGQRWRDINNARQQQYQNQLNAYNQQYNQQQAANQDFWSGLGSLGLGLASLPMTGGASLGGMGLSYLGNQFFR